ncbi:MAG: prepilin-type N-terminal cleavage/methylation domain-containing protein, partial [Clostridia bacterium]|nr:prepilin-type N-terminal cleavage/methylation domain-containing protein [Clostridia bacterium]
MNKKGFTLIEILTVIIILGVIMIIAVPAVSKYILGSRDSAYVTSIEKYIEAARNEVTDFEYIVSRDDTTYYIPTKCLKVENGENSPYGEMQESYVVVTTNNLGKHKYYYLGRDETNHGMTLTPSDEVDTDHLSSEVTIIDKTQMLDGTTRVAVYKDDCSKQTESTTNTSLANCGTVTGESDVWTKDDRTITVACVG